MRLHIDVIHVHMQIHTRTHVKPQSSKSTPVVFIISVVLNWLKYEEEEEQQQEAASQPALTLFYILIVLRFREGVAL